MFKDADLSDTREGSNLIRNPSHIPKVTQFMLQLTPRDDGATRLEIDPAVMV